MKTFVSFRTLVLLLFLVCSVQCYSQTYYSSLPNFAHEAAFKDSVYAKDLWWDKTHFIFYFNPDGLYNAEAINEKGEKLDLGDFKDGNGTLVFTDGKSASKMEWENGQLKTWKGYSDIKKGKLDGEQEYDMSNARVAHRISYFKDGTIQSETTIDYKTFVMNSKIYNEKGILRKEEMIDSLNQIKTIKNYYDSGTLMRDITYTVLSASYYTFHHIDYKEDGSQIADETEKHRKKSSDIISFQWSMMFQ